MSARRKEPHKILFAHSAGAQYAKGKGSYDLLRYLKTKLSDAFKIISPVIEKPNSPTYSKFKRLFSSALKDIDEPVILVGHSLGASTLLKYLSEEKPAISVAGLYLVATPHWKSSMKEFQLKNNFETSIKDTAIFLYHSRRDNIVPFEHLTFYEESLKGATVRKLSGGEHLFSRGLPELVADIRAL